MDDNIEEESTESEDLGDNNPVDGSHSDVETSDVHQENMETLTKAYIA